MVKVRETRSRKKTGPAVPPRPASHPRTAAAHSDLAVGVGLATVDLLCVVPRVEQRLVEVSVFSMQGGGSAANILAVLSTLGVRGRYFGRVGDDEFGRFILRSLQQLHIDTSVLAIEKGKVSPVSIIQIDELSHKRKILLSRGNVTPLSTRDLPDRLLDGAQLLCIDGSQPALQAAVAEKARAKGITVLLNASQLSGGMGELLTLSDIVVGSERFANELAPSDELATSLREITRLGPRIAVITMGEAGAVALEGTKLVQQDAVDVFVEDTTGAGDAFCGAFAYAQLKSWPLERALPFANAAAGLACRSLGSRSGLPTVDEVTDAVKRG
jgi:sugar/nucleoside kinase (ribokinase family)